MQLSVTGKRKSTPAPLVPEQPERRRPGGLRQFTVEAGGIDRGEAADGGGGEAGEEPGKDAKGLFED